MASSPYGVSIPNSRRSGVNCTGIPWSMFTFPPSEIPPLGRGDHLHSLHFLTEPPQGLFNYLTTHNDASWNLKLRSNFPEHFPNIKTFLCPDERTELIFMGCLSSMSLGNNVICFLATKTVFTNTPISVSTTWFPLHFIIKLRATMQSNPQAPI